MFFLRSKRAIRFIAFLTLAGFLATGCGAPTDAPEAPAAEEPEPTSSAPAPPERNIDEQVILFLGNSLTAGYGLDPAQAFPALVQEKIDSLGWSFQVENAGLSGETSAGGLRRVDWLLRQPIDVMVLELGGNDGLRGISTADTHRNLQRIIDRTREKNPDVRIVLAGMQIPTNLGQDYTAAFRAIFPELAEENDVPLIPFLLEGVGGVPELNLPDGIHPTARGHQIVAENVWSVLKPVLEELRAERSV